MRRLPKIGRGRTVLLALGVGGALFGIATAVQASIPDSSGVIHGCFYTPSGRVSGPATNASRQVGDVRVVDTESGHHCTSNETPLDWNQTGPSGPSGPSGERGPSDAWLGPASDATTLTPFATPGNSADLVSVTVPAGNFVLTGNVWALDSTGTVFVRCHFSEGNPDGDLDAGVSVPSGAFVVFPLQNTAVVSTGPTTIKLHCQNESDTASVLVKANLIALQVATLH